MSQLVSDLRDQIDQRDRKAGMIPVLERELAILRDKYEREMRNK